MYFLAYPFANILLLLYTFLGNSTIAAIAALTLLLNLIVLPLNISQQRSARKMREMQPEIEKIRKKYSNDPERLNQETMKLYQKAGTNPLGGCLTLLIQMPIWFGLIGAIRYCIPSTPMDLFEFSQHIFAWLPGVTGIVPLQSTFLGMDLGLPPNAEQWWSYSLPILVGVTSFLQQKLLSPSSSKDEAEQTPSKPSENAQPSQSEMMEQQMQMMSVTMPLMMVMFTLSYPTGLSIYFIISSVIRVIQYYFINRAHEKEENEKNNN